MVVNTGNVFSALALSEYMASSLPKEPAPQLRNPFDAIALLTHACMLAVGFRLIGLGEDHSIGIVLHETLRRLPFLPLSHMIAHSLTRTLQKPNQIRQPHNHSPPSGTPPPLPITPSATPTANPHCNTSSKSPVSAAKPSSTASASATKKSIPSTSSLRTLFPNPPSPTQPRLQHLPKLTTTTIITTRTTIITTMMTTTAKPPSPSEKSSFPQAE